MEISLAAQWLRGISAHVRATCSSGATELDTRYFQAVQFGSTSGRASQPGAGVYAPVAAPGEAAWWPAAALEGTFGSPEVVSLLVSEFGVSRLMPGADVGTRAYDAHRENSAIEERIRQNSRFGRFWNYVISLIPDSIQAAVPPQQPSWLAGSWRDGGPWRRPLAQRR